MPITGIEQLDKIGKVLLGIPSVMSRASTDAAKELEAVIEAQFSGGHDPYGQPWAPLKSGGASHLTETGALRGVSVTPQQGAGLTVEFGAEYGKYHQSGTSRMPARKLWPDDGTFQQSLWNGAIAKAYSNALLKNAGWRAAGADVTYDTAAE